MKRRHGASTCLMAGLQLKLSCQRGGLQRRRSSQRPCPSTPAHAQRAVADFIAALGRPRHPERDTGARAP